MQLVRPGAHLEFEFLEMVEEFRAAGERRFDAEPGLERGDFPAYLRFLREGARGRVAEGALPWSAFWLVRPASGRILGVSSLRHGLSPYLVLQGGHIGYAIRPTERRKGYGTAILRKTLGEARSLGLPRVLIVCGEEDLASRKVIERNGGRLENVVLADGGAPLYRFRIVP